MNPSFNFNRTAPNLASVQTEGLDTTVLWLMGTLLLWGLVMVYSTTIGMPDNPKFAKYSQLHFLNRHLLSLLIASAAGLIAYQIPMSLWERTAPYIFIAALVLLALVLVPHIGVVVNRARRWINLGLMQFQPSEFAKFATVLYAANYMVRKIELRENFFKAVWPMATAVAAMGVLLLSEPDMGAFVVIAVIAMGILFLGGVNARMFFLIGSVLLLTFFCMVAFNETRRERFFAFLNPFDVEYALGKGYQLSHALIALGRGEIFGVGLGGSIEKMHWLPEAHTDFMLAVIGEEFGLIGVLTVLGLFFWMVKKMIYIGRQAINMDRVFAGLVAEGVGIWMGFQMLINVAVNVGAMPTKGLTLPLMSYGGSALLLNLIAVAVVLRVDKENHQMKSGRSI
jgi:cell division protein FtsW